VRVFCDADVLIAGSASTTGASHILLRLSELTLIECVTSRQAIAEAERNLAAKIPSALPAFGAIIAAAAVVMPDPALSVRQRLAGQAHPKDIAILAAAVAVGADFLATFNVRHFRVKHALPIVLSPGMVLARVRRSLTALLGEWAED